jgi:hypothetical protein
MKKKGNNNKLYRESPEFNTKYSKASALFDILLKAAPPLSKVASATPANGSVFDPSCREFWSNIVNEDAACYDAIASTNARKIGAFYRDKINKMAPWLMESLSKLLNGGSSCEVMTCILDATISGRPLQQSKFDAVRSAAIHYGIRDLVE